MEKISQELEEKIFKKDNKEEIEFFYNFFKYYWKEKKYIEPLFYFSIVERRLYEIGLTVNEETIKKYILDINGVLSIPHIEYKEHQSYKKDLEPEKKIKLSIDIITSLILTFPFVTDKIFRYSAHGAIDPIPFHEFNRFLAKCFPKSRLVESVIVKNCKDIANMILAIKEIMKEENKSLDSISLWKNILLSSYMTIATNKSLCKISQKYYEITLKISKATEEILREKYEESTDSKKNKESFISSKRDTSERIKSLNDEIRELYPRIVEYHTGKQSAPFFIAEKKEASKSFEKIVEEIEKKSELLLEQFQQERKIFQIIGNYDAINHELFSLFDLEESLNTLFIQEKIIEYLTMRKVLLAINEFNENSIRMSPKEFAKSLEKLNPEALVGLSFFVRIAKIVNSNLDKEKVHLMGNFVKILKENSSDSVTIKRILKCEEKMARIDESKGFPELFSKKREEFEEIFKGPYGPYSESEIRNKKSI